MPRQAERPKSDGPRPSGFGHPRLQGTQPDGARPDQAIMWPTRVYEQPGRALCAARASREATPL
ncbi:uncharacterized protein B0H18DRAFT_972464, partial [Fomitopsis serialis]|uniref:uncharacterized protein n=1 Tax=Fomitopsis serialis TaxID=139415 RepID=UPI002007F148